MSIGFRLAAEAMLGVFLVGQAVSLPPPPGRIVEAGGRKLHLHCTGSGGPIVVIEAGASSFAIDFALVQPEIAKFTRVCSYDRLGHGWSDAAGDKDPDSTSVLHALLEAAGERPPYVLAGASRGGLLVRHFVARYATEVAGLVLIDPSHEDRLFTVLDGKSIAIAKVTAEQMRATFKPGPPIRIPRRSPQTGTPFDRLPADLYKTRIALDERLIASQPETVPMEVVHQAQERERAHLARLRQERLAQPHPLGDRPLVVLSRGLDTSPERDASFATLASISSNSRHTVVPAAGHEIHLFDPSAVTLAVQDVVGAVRSKAKLPPR